MMWKAGFSGIILGWDDYITSGENMKELCTSSQMSANKSLCLLSLLMHSCSIAGWTYLSKFFKSMQILFWIIFNQILIFISFFWKILDLSKTDDVEGSSTAFCHHFFLECTWTEKKILCRIACYRVTKDPDVCREFQEREDQKRVKPEHIRSLGGSLTFWTSEFKI